MILSPDMVRAVAAGRKTVHRRPTRSDHPCTYHPGKTYPVMPGRGQRALVRVTVTEVRVDVLGALTFADARAEGFRSTEPFKVKWVHQYDRQWVARQDDPDDELLLERFDARHADRSVWVIGFRLSREDTPRLLAARPAPDYVANGARALRETARHLVGEAVSEAEQAWITARAGMTTAQWHVLEAAHADARSQERSVEERVQSACQRAALAGVDVSREVFKVRAVRAAGRPDGVVLRWVQALERKAHLSGLERAA